MFKKGSILSFKADSDSSDSMENVVANKNQKKKEIDDLFADSSDEETENENVEKKEQEKEPKEKNDDNDDGFGLLKFGGGKSIKAALGYDEDDENTTGESTSDDVIVFRKKPSEKDQKGKEKKTSSSNESEAKANESSAEEKKQGSEEAKNEKENEEKPAESQNDESESDSADIFEGVKFKPGEAFDEESALVAPAQDDVANDLFSSSSSDSSDNAEEFSQIRYDAIEQKKAIPLGRLTKIMTEEKDRNNSSENASCDSLSAQSSGRFAHTIQPILPPMPQLNQQQPFVMPFPTMHTFFQPNLNHPETPDYNQPRVVNWLQFQLPDIPELDSRYYDQLFDKEYSLESLYEYSKK